MGQVFLSYSRHDDEPFVKQLYEDLTKNGIDVWWDRKTMESRGRTFLQELRDAIEASDRLIAIVGPNAVTSDYVKVEWEHALLFAKGVVPILRIGDHNLVPPELSKLHCPDFRKERQYNEALEELLRILSEPLPKLGPFLTSIPSLPPNYLPRKEYLNKLNELIMADIFRPVVTTSTKQITTLQGMGGTGKSVLAAAFARTTENRRAFNDGVLWATVGSENPDLIGNMRLIGTELGDDPANYSNQKQAEASLSKVLSDKVCLIVLDDVWKVPDVTPFVNALGPRCRLLITTRNEDVVTSLGAKECKIEVLSEHSALELMANWCEQEVNSLPSETAKVAGECGYLPLALSMCGAMAKSGTAWSDILEALKEADLEYIEAQLPNYTNTNVMRALKISIDFLSSEDPEAIQRYQELAIFPPDELVPEAALETLWTHTGNLKKRDSGKLLTKLKDRALLRLDGEVPHRLISLHDLQLDYLRATAKDLPSLHNQLLEAYHKECGNKWCAGPADGYFFEHLAYHMKEGRRKDDLHKLLLDFEWMCAKLDKVYVIQRETEVRKPKVSSLLCDYDYLPNDTEIKLVQDAIRLSYNVILKDKTQLAGQLLGRLFCFHETGIQSLLSQARECKDGIRLLPKTSSLRPPGGPLIRTLGEHNNWVNAVAVTPNGKYVVSASSDKTLKVWDLERGEEKTTLKGHEHQVRTVAVTPDGRYAVSGSDDGILKVWDLEKEEEKATLKGHEIIVTAVATTPDGKYAVSASHDNTLKIWDLEKGGKRATINLNKYWVNAVAITSDGKNAVLGSSDRTLKVWDLERWEEKATMEGHKSSVSAVAIVPGGKYVISGSDDGTLKVWDLERGEEKVTMNLYGHWVNAVAVTPDGKYAVSASRDRTLKVWDLERWEEKATMEGHESSVNAVAIIPGGKYVISGSDDGTLKVWDLERGEEEITQEERDYLVIVIAIITDEKYAISVSDDRTLEVWDLEKGEGTKMLRGDVKCVNSLAVTPDGKYGISGSRDGTLIVWDLEKMEEKVILNGPESPVNTIAITPDGKYAASVSSDRTLIIWDLEKREKKVTLRELDGRMMIFAVTPDGKYAVLVSIFYTLKVLDLEKGEEKTTLYRREKDAFTPDFKYKVSISDDRTLEVWDLEKMGSVASFTGDSTFLTCNISPDGKIIVASDTSGKMHFLNLEKPN